LIWDSDVNPEGVAVKYVWECYPVEVFANGGGFWLDERSSDTDAGLWGGQAGLKYNLNSSTYLLGGASLYDFTHLKDQMVLGDPTKPLGNSAYKVGSSNYYYDDYRLMEGFAELGFKVANLPVSVLGDFVKNTSFGEENQAFLVGFTLGKCKDPGSWSCRYDYRRVESDAVLGAISDSDFIGGGTDGKGHELGFDYQVTKPLKLGVTYFRDDKNLDSEKEYHRAQVDVNYKF